MTTVADVDPRGDTTEPAIRVTGVSHRFGADDDAIVTALDDVAFDVEDGTFLAIVGASGCGKTTMLNLIAGLETGQEGTIEIDGRPPQAGRSDIAYLFARDSLLPWRDVVGNIEIGMQLRGVPRRERLERAREYCEKVGLAQHADAYPAQLSHGMRQRVALARTIAQHPRIILLDEPFSALDAQTRIAMQTVFTTLWEELRSTVVLITHDLGEAVAMADRVLLFSARPGRLRASYDIGLDRPRDPIGLQSDAAYHALHDEIWARLRTEVQA